MLTSLCVLWFYGHALHAQTNPVPVRAQLLVTPQHIADFAPNNDIQLITKDRLNRLWFLSKHGNGAFKTSDFLQLTCFNGVQAIDYRLDSLPGLNIHIKINKIIFQDPQHIFFIPGYEDAFPLEKRGLYYFDIPSRSIREAKLNGQSLRLTNPFLIEDDALWVSAVLDGKPWLFMIRDTTVKPAFKLEVESQKPIHITTDSVWTYTDKEIICYSSQGHELHRILFPPAIIGQVSMLAWTTGQIEIMTHEGKLFWFNPQNFSFRLSPITLLSNTGCSGIYSDASGNRLYLYSFPHTFKQAYLLTANGILYDLGDAVKVMASVSDTWHHDFMDVMWFSRSQDIFEVRLQNLSVRRFLSNSSIRKISRSSDGHLYVATETDGIYQSSYGPNLNFTKSADHGFNRFFYKDGDRELYNANYFLCRKRGSHADTLRLDGNPHDIVQTDPHHLVVAGQANGLALVDLDAWTIRLWIPMKARVIHHVVMPHPDSAYITTDEGLLIGDVKNGITSRLFTADPPICMLQDKDHQWILGTTGGYLIRTTLPNTGNIDTLAITGNSIVTITPDDQQNLWIGTFAGIYVYSPGANSLRKLSYPELEQIECNRYSAFYDSLYHRILIGTLEGLYEVDTRTARLSDTAPSIFLSSLYAYGLTGNQRDTVYFNGDDHYAFRLGAYHRSFTVTFSPGLMADRASIRYAYVLLKGQNRPDDMTSWTENGNTPTLTLSNLESGTYTLWIKAMQPGNHKASNYLRLTFRADPYFYNRWWFYALVASLIALAVYYRNRFLKEENIRLEHEVDKRTRQIQQDKETIQQQAEALTELDAMKNRFFTHISHELKTPLTLIKGPIERLMRHHQDQPKEEKEMLELIQRNAGLLTDRVNELLELSRLERKTVQLDLHPQNMQAFMSQYVDLFKHQAGLLGIQLSIETTFEKPVYNIDAPKTGKIIQNLITNALKYCPRGTNLQVRIAIRDETCSIIVKDDGPGIDPIYHERIFEKFYQVPDQQQHHDPGSGIGLSMVKEYVDLMHGMIELNSRAGQGAEFRITFPVREFNDLSSAEVADINDDISDMETPFFQIPEGASILVVEDNPELRLYLENILNDHFRVASIANGREAIEWLNSNHTPDLILSDIMMPEMDGLQLLEWIRQQEQYAMLPFIFLTAKNQDHTRLRALRLGVDDYIHKPFSDLELVLRISRLLHHAQVRQLEHSGAVEEDASLGEIPRENATILQVQEFIRTHMTDPTFSAIAVAEYVGVSERTLRRFIRRETGMSTKELITEVQLDQLRRLREEYPHDTITSLSARVGYTDPKYMARIFHERWGYRL